jgi:Ca2+-binding EF-hand superfamily protein
MNLNLREKDVGEFYKFFQLIDTDQDGFIQYFELFKFLEMETTKFSIHIFDIYDVEKVGMTFPSLPPPFCTQLTLCLCLCRDDEF